jgi:hypothetical protein
VAFDSNGNGLALWRAIDDYGLPQIFASRLTQPAGTWSAATTLPPTVGAPGDTQLGIPAVAFDATGRAIAIWFDKKSSVIRASRYQPASGWDTPLAISGAETVTILDEAPALVFDGSDFVAAWTAESGGKLYTYTARYAASSGWDVPQRRQTVAADGFSASHMPRVGSDGRGNLLLVWAKGTAPNFSLVYQRFTGGMWRGIQEIDGAGIKSPTFESSQALPFAVNPNGLGVVAWGNYDATTLTAVRLASFF